MSLRKHTRRLQRGLRHHAGLPFGVVLPLMAFFVGIQVSVERALWWFTLVAILVWLPILYSAWKTGR